MKFIYQAKTKKGASKSGELDAADRDEALRTLKERNLVVVSLVREQTKSLGISIRPISVFERVVLTKHLGIMLKAGVNLDEALRIAELQATGKLRAVLTKVREDVEGGMRLADALAQHPKVFSQYYVNMVKAGEESGNLAQNLEQLSVRFSKDFELRQKALAAMLYPAIVVGLTFGLAMIISLFVLPRLSSLFSAFSFELPWSTRALIFVSQVLADYGTWIVLVLVAFLVGLILIARSQFARPFVDGLMLRIPVVKNITKPLNLARFSNVLGSLLQSGLPIGAALAVTQQVIGNIQYKRAIAKAAERVDRGEPLAEALSADEFLFPPFVHRMIQIGDETGKTEDVLRYLSEFYENELDVTLKNLSTIIEPVLLVSIGLVVAFVALSIITPIYGFISAVG